MTGSHVARCVGAVGIPWRFRGRRIGLPPACGSRLFRRYVETTSRGSGEALGAIHVLDRRCRVDKGARRHGANDIGDRGGRSDRWTRATTPVSLAEEVERGDEAVVAELGMFGLPVALQPIQALQIAAVDEARVFDLQSRRQAIDEHDAAAGFVT